MVFNVLRVKFYVSYQHQQQRTVSGLWVCVCVFGTLILCWVAEKTMEVFLLLFFFFYSYKNGKLNLNKAGSQATNLFDNKKLTSLAKANRLLASSTRKVTCCRVRTWVWICLHQNQLDAIGSNLSYKVLKKKRVS